MPLSEHVYCVAVAFKMTEQLEQQICIKSCIKLEHSSTETIQMIQQATAWATDDWQLHHDNIPAHASHFVQSVFAKHQIAQVTQCPLQLRFGARNFRVFPKLKSPLKGNKFQTIHEIQENTVEQLTAIPTKDFAECF